MDYQEPYRFYFLPISIFAYLVCYLGEVACFETSSFRHTPIYFSSEKYFKYVLKISDSLFHQSCITLTPEANVNIIMPHRQSKS